jgi:arylsulfatase A-like enzyme
MTSDTAEIENVLLVTIDSLRKDIGSVPGRQTIAALESDGVAFERAFATGPGTSPSFPALLTGTLPLSYGGLGPLSDDRPRVAEILNENGLATGGFQCNPFLSTHFNYDTGFDAFEDYQNPLMGIVTRIFPRGIEINNPKLRRVDEYLRVTDAIKSAYQLIHGKPRPYVSAEVITDDTIEWLSRIDGPFFCWAHYMDVHHPCFPPAEYRERVGAGSVSQTEVSEWYSAVLDDPETLGDWEKQMLQQLYRGSIDYVDDQIQRLLAHLRETDRYEKTLVIVTSDHGELFGDHGQYGKPERMYDELLHVPLIVSNGPPHLHQARTELVSLLDIPPLIHDALGLPTPDAYEGRLPGVDTSREYILAEHEVEGDVIIGARTERWLYEGDEIRDEHRLFDFEDSSYLPVKAVDNNLGTETVRRAVLERLQKLDVETGRPEEGVDGDIESRLKDLGYL